jgi:hypothetical protein
MQRVAEEAFVREYARSHDPRLENRWAFHSEKRALPMPGVADHVLAGVSEPPEDPAKSPTPLPDQYRLEVRGRDVLVWRPIQGNMIRTAEGSDRFCAKAGEVVQRLSSTARRSLPLESA